MASSDDEGETVPTTVSDYEFIGDDEPISFSKLPVDWSKGDSSDGKKLQIYLTGKTDNGLRKIYVQVTGWKFDLPKGKPEISVLSTQGNWIKLLNPRKPYYDIIRTVVVTLHALHFAKWNPQRPQKALWDNLKKTFSMFERRPCVADLADHLPLITEAIKWDVKLEESQLLSSFLAEKPWKKKTFNEDVRPPFIVDDANEKEDLGESEKADENEDSDSEEADENEDSDSDESDCFDSVCAICDNGGNLLICDGKCMRSFHATAEDGDDSKCESLELTVAELDAMRNVPFICDNCKYKMHQCFACGKLGSSDELSNPEVFCCVNGACGYFYHPHCVATLFHPGDSAATEELEKRIADGESFACPIHKCHVCKELEVRSDPEMQFAVCRRCPKAYHRKCLPRKIAFEDSEFIQRAWEGLIPKRILIYCLDHEVDEEILTPTRDHLVFPGPRKEKKRRLELEASKNKNLSKERGLALEDNAGNRFSGKQQKVNGSKGVGLSRKRLEELPTPSSKKQKLAATRASNDRFSSGPSIRLSREKLKQPTNDEGGVFSDDKSSATFFGTESEPVNRRVASGHDDNEITKKVKPTAKRSDNTLILDADARRRVLTLMKDASSSVTLEDVKKRYKPPSTHTSYSRFSTDSVTLGKVEGSVQAVHAALTKLDEGSVRDAKAVCGNDLLLQVEKWKDKLKVYLAPFLHGVRYTSFGRHFTKNDKLKEIADILHWYVQDGDMLVDFCCGSNDFSCLMKRKLDEMGKICSFKNYDILQAKNDFNFERRDWMSVKKEELPDGSKLIMGLNPPFGLNASLANKFINKALEFKPKLLILIVPRETQRLDEKQPPYDLIWEEDQMLAGKAFYLPGSVDVNDKQIEDWNNNPPVLYLWSSPAWTSKHRDIAETQSHKSGALKNLHTTDSIQAFDDEESSVRGEEKHADTPKNPRQMGNEIISHQEGKDKETTSQQEGLPCSINSTPKNLEQKETISHQDGLPRDINSAEVGKSQAEVNNHPESSSKSFGGKGNKKRPASNMDKSFSKLSVSRHQSPDHLETYSTKRGETSSQLHSERGDYWPNREVHSERDGHQQLSLSREVSQVPCERGGYQQTSNFSSRQSYSRMEHNGDGDEMSELLLKYGAAAEPELGTSGGQAYDNHDYAQPPQHSMSSGHAYREEQAYGNHDYAQPPQHSMSSEHAYRDYAPLVATGGLMDNGYNQSPVQVHPNSWNRGAALSPYQGTGYSQQYGLRNIAPSSNYSEMSRPASHRYAARLHETNHDPSFLREAHFPPPQHPNHAPLQLPNQGSLNFAQGPYNPPPHQTSSGWLHDD